MMTTTFHFIFQESIANQPPRNEESSMTPDKGGKDGSCPPSGLSPLTGDLCKSNLNHPGVGFSKLIDF